MSKVWFVTGSARGLGRAIVTAALERGDRVAASTRNIKDLSGLVDQFGDAVLPLVFDVKNRAAAVPALASARKKYGRIDVVVNNAGRGLMAALEEATESEVRDLMDTNLFGTLWVTQAALPIMREQGGGHIVQITSGGGVISWPVSGIYQASKFGIDGMSEALAQEAAHLGIKVTIVQAGHMATDFGRSVVPKGPAIPVYDKFREMMAAGVQSRPGSDPNDLARKLLKVVDAKQPPLRVLLGRPLQDIKTAYEERLKVWAEWENLA